MFPSAFRPLGLVMTVARRFATRRAAATPKLAAERLNQAKEVTRKVKAEADAAGK